jgi:hypothetical protein
MWQRIWRPWPARVWADPEDDRDLLGGDFNLLDQGADNLTTEAPVRISQSRAHFTRELVQSPDDQLEVMCGGEDLGLLLCVLLQGGDALVGCHASMLHCSASPPDLSHVR